jgi:RNA-directed DNA polymerase
VIHNLYIVFTPLIDGMQKVTIEDLFTKETLSEKLSGKTFNKNDNYDTKTEYGKEYFAKKVVLAKKSSIDFSGFKDLLERIEKCISHYNDQLNETN